jgi:hypothetical protein
MRRASRWRDIGGTRHQPDPLEARTAAWCSRRERVVYAIGILAPLVALAFVAAFGGESSRLVSELPSGGFLEWIYPLGDP